MNNNKPLFFTLKGKKEEVDEAFQELKTFYGHVCKNATVSCNTTNVSDTITAYTFTLEMTGHPFHGEFPRQCWEAKVNWEHKGFTVQYHYTMTPAGEDNTVYFDLLYLPCMDTMHSTMAAWMAFYRFVQNISVKE